MLILTRKENERIVCSNGMVILVTEIADGRVRLGFDAPPEIKIWREELWPRHAEPPERSEVHDQTEDAL